MLSSSTIQTFPGGLEDEFRRRYNESSAFVARVCLALGAALFLAFHLWDRLLDDEVTSYTLAVRLVVFAVFVTVIAMSRSEFFLRHLQGIMATMTLFAGAAVVLIISMMKDALSLGLAGVVLVLVFNAGFSRVLFLPSLLVGALLAVIYNIAVVTQAPPPTLLAVHNFVLIAAVISGAFVSFLLEKLFRAQFLASKELEKERNRARSLLETLLPPHIAARLEAGERKIAQSHAEVTVLFADLVGFTQLTHRLSPGHLIDVLNEIFSVFDSLAQKWGVEKIKTIGDAYMVVCGLEHRSNCAEPVADFALEMVDIVKEYAAKHNFPISIRVGISTGQVTSGVIGLTKPTFDVWGETVTLASRMEALAATERVQVSETAFWRLREDFELEPRGPIEVKGFGRVEAYFLIGRRTVASQTAADDEPARPDGAQWFVAARPAQTEAAAPVSNAPARVDGTHERASQPHGRDERP